MKKLAILALLAGGITVVYYPPARLSAWVLLGRNQNCPYDNALRIPDDLTEQISRKDKILAASRVLERDDKGYKRWETPHGNYWVPAGSDYVLPFNLAEQERNIYGWNGHGVKSGDVVLDCGANVGVYTRVALNAGAKLVVAIEPAPDNLECLRRNFAPEVAAGRVIVYPKGVWNKDDFLVLHVDPHNSAADSFVIDKSGWTVTEKVPLTTIDKMIDELKLQTVDFIKMDIEGAEVRAMEGAKHALERFKPRIAVSAYHQEDHPTEIPRAVREGYAQYQMECGPCAETRFGVRPDILYFFP